MINLPAILIVAASVYISCRCMFFNRNGYHFSRLKSVLAYILVVGTGWVAIETITGERFYSGNNFTNWGVAVTFITLALLTAQSRGNVARIMEPDLYDDEHS